MYISEITNIHVLKKILIALFCLLLFGVYYLYVRMPIINGYTAKCACTQYYENNRPLADIVSEDFDKSALRLASVSADDETRSMTSSIWGMRPRTAIYQPKLGCKLLQGTDDYQVDIPKHSSPSLSDTLPWPYGNNEISSSRTPIDKAKIIDVAFDPGYDTDIDRMIHHKTRSLLVVHKNNIVLEAYEKGFDRDTPILGWSMTKSWMNALIGILIQEGKLKLEQDHLFPNWTDDRSEITLDNLLTMTSGLDWEEEYATISDATRMLYMSENIVEGASDNPLAYTPGTHWYYSSGTSNLLSGIIRNQFSTVDDYLLFPHVALFDKLGMTNSFMEIDESGNYIGSSYGFATTRDWAKFGLLYLHDGVWNGERILPEGWVDYTQSEVSSSHGKYGAHFWLNKRGVAFPDAPYDTYSANGYQGQKVLIIPSEDLVIVRTGLNSDFDFNSLISTIIKEVNK